MARTEVHLDNNRWLIRTSIRDTAPMRLIAGARAKPSDLLKVAEWTVPATVETAKQLKFTFPGAVWLDEAKAHRGLLASLRKERIGLQEDRDPRKLETPTGTKELAPFQALGVDWLFGVSGVLADDMGLGKTVQLSVAAQRHALYKSSSLVLCPVAALGVWEQHLTEWTDIKPFRFHGSSRAKALTAFHDYKGPKALISTHGLIERHSYQVNYGSLGREGKEGEFNIDWDLLIIDEAHKIGVTPGGKRVRATMAVTRSCAQVWCATGTPVNDSPRDMWVLMSYVNPELFGSYDCFTSRYCIMRENPWDIDNLGLHPDLEDEYEWMIRPWMLRRLKETHGKDIPDALPPQVITLPMTGPQTKAYNQIVKDSLALIDQEDGKRLLISQGNLPNYAVLKYIAAGVPVVSEDHRVTGLQWRNSNKFEYLRDLATDRAGDPFVIYAYSSKEVQMYADGLRHEGFRVGTITGDTPGDQRDATVAMFQRGELAVILVTDAGGDSITLTAADLVVLARPSRRPSANQQVMKRVDRWGQTRPPQCQILVSEGTVDETDLASLAGKINIQEEMTLDKKRLKGLLKGTPTT